MRLPYINIVYIVLSYMRIISSCELELVTFDIIPDFPQVSRMSRLGF